MYVFSLKYLHFGCVKGSDSLHYPWIMV